MALHIKEHPILFSAPMVRAILEGRKAQTRRVVKPQPHLFRCREDQWFHERKWMPTTPSGKVGLVPEITMPYCVGDRLWVRESGWVDDEKRFFAYHATRTLSRCADDPRGVFIEVAPEDVCSWSKDDYEEGGWKRCPSIHMPRWASRLTLEVTDVRVQRVQEISEGDALAEGIWECEAGFWWYAPESQKSLHRDTLTPEGCKGGAVAAFAALWDSINGKRPGCGWQDNPFVWAVSFRKVEQP